MSERAVITAYNYAAASENKIHSDETAVAYGFRGGLVPGVGVYAYMTVPVVRAWGKDWIARGSMWGKFLKPVYDGERVSVTATPIAENKLETQVLNSEGTLCAVGEAALRHDESAPDLTAYPKAPLPQKKYAAEVAALPKGLALGSLEYVFHANAADGESGRVFADEVVDPLPLYRGTDALCHPAQIAAKANALLVANVDLGPWIHTESQAWHYAIAHDGEVLSLRGFIADSFERRGHIFAVCDLALFGERERVLGRIVHTAIVRPVRKG